MTRKDAQDKLRQANLKRQEEQRAWDQCHRRSDPESFTSEVLPLLQDVSLYQMRAATGLSITYCAQIRRGQVPHPRHWEHLRLLASSKD